jgi:hypothetical protein
VVGVRGLGFGMGALDEDCQACLVRSGTCFVDYTIREALEFICGGKAFD